MKLMTRLITLAHCCALVLTVNPLRGATESDRMLFEEQCSRPWQVAFHDDGLGDWTNQWFLDGVHAKVVNSQQGLRLDTSDGFAVLWTKEEFEGDLKIEYDFQRVDASNRGVNIIYIQARGKGTPGFDRDITKWSEKRKLAAMKNYYNNMDTYHISYAVFTDNYIRGRRYMPIKGGLDGTELEGTVMHTGLFETGHWYHVTIIKREMDLVVEFRGQHKTLLCRLVNTDKPGIHVGRIGLRLMPGRESLFKNFKVSTTR